MKDTVEDSSGELLLINAVLKQEIPPEIQLGEVAEALQKTDELEVKIQTAAQDLAQVNKALTQEIDERADLERELADTKAALAEATSNSPRAY